MPCCWASSLGLVYGPLVEYIVLWDQKAIVKCKTLSVFSLPTQTWENLVKLSKNGQVGRTDFGSCFWMTGQTCLAFLVGLCEDKISAVRHLMELSSKLISILPILSYTYLQSAPNDLIRGLFIITPKPPNT